jgi:hypothetical protein
MKLGRLDHIGVATPSIADSLPVIPSIAKQSRLLGKGLDCRVASLLAKTNERDAA